MTAHSIQSLIYKMVDQCLTCQKLDKFRGVLVLNALIYNNNIQACNYIHSEDVQQCMYMLYMQCLHDLDQDDLLMGHPTIDMILCLDCHTAYYIIIVKHFSRGEVEHLRFSQFNEHRWKGAGLWYINTHMTSSSNIFK